MNDATIAQHHRLQHVLRFQESGGSQREYCRQAHTPTRKILAKYLKAFQEGGPPALLSRRNIGCPTNRTTLQDEARILEYVKLNPGHGPQRIANEMRNHLSVGHTGVYGVLKRKSLNRRRDREEWARIQLGQIVTKSEIETARQKARHRHVEVSFPGELWGNDTFLVGRLKAVGMVYHHLAVDLASSYGIAKLYPSRSAENACDFLQHHLQPKAKNLGIHACLQDNGTEFTAARWRHGQKHSNHAFEKLAARLGIELRFIRPGHAWTNGTCERLHQTLLHEFYIPALCQKIYASLEDLDYDLQLFMAWYNHHRTHQGYRLKGCTPAQVYFSGATPQKDFFFHVA